MVRVGQLILWKIQILERQITIQIIVTFLMTRLIYFQYQKVTQLPIFLIFLLFQPHQITVYLFLLVKQFFYLDSLLNQFCSVSNFPSIYSQSSTNLPLTTTSSYSQPQFSSNSLFQVPINNKNFVCL